MSRVIRGTGEPARVVPAEIVDARKQAAQILERARAEAAQIVAEARAQADGIRDAAAAEGLARARAEMAGMLADAARARDRALAAAETEIQALALAVARNIVGESIALEPGRIVAIVREAISRARRARHLEVQVHPDDATALASAPLEGARVVPDPSIARGGCVVRSELGTIDARIEVRLEAMARLLGVEKPA